MKQKEFMLRLMRYKRVLMQLRIMGLERVFSSNLGDALGVSAALVRRDLSYIDMQGNRRGGYNIDTMLDCINKALGSSKTQKTIVVGCGNLGKALLNNERFSQEDINITAGFDITPQEESINGIPLYTMENLENYINENEIKVAITTIPVTAAPEIKDRLVNAGILGILNFAPIELKGQGNVVIQNVNIGLEIENLFFKVNSINTETNRPCGSSGPCSSAGPCTSEGPCPDEEIYN